MSRFDLRGEQGQATLLLLGVVAALLAGTLVLFGFGQALGARSKHQRAADLAAVSAAQLMRRHYTRLFEAAVFENGEPNPRHLSNDGYLALARAAALRGARRNGVAPARVCGRLRRPADLVHGHRSLNRTMPRISGPTRCNPPRAVAFGGRINESRQAAPHEPGGRIHRCPHGESLTTGPRRARGAGGRRWRSRG